MNLSAKSRGQGPEASETLGIDMEIVPSVLIQGCSKDNRGGGHVGEGVTAGVTGVLGLSLEGERSVSSPDARAGQTSPPWVPPLTSVTSGVRHLATMAPLFTGQVTWGKGLSIHVCKMG